MSYMTTFYRCYDVLVAGRQHGSVAQGSESMHRDAGSGINFHEMGQKMNKLLAGLTISVASLMACSASYAASDSAKATYKAAQDSADAQYKVAQSHCDTFSGNAKDVCEQEAKLERTRTKANAEASYKNTAKAHSKAMVDIADAEYEVAKEKCDDRAGNDKDVCVKEAKAAKAAAVAKAKSSRKVTEARTDAADTRADANYKVALEKCDALAGDAKDACVANAKNKFGK